MKKAILITILIILAAIIIFINIPKEQNPIVGASCGTVSPDSRDQCCYIKFSETGFPECQGLRIFYDLDEAECKFICSDKNIACTEEAKQCPDGTWTSRTGILYCQFRPCGYE